MAGEEGRESHTWVALKSNRYVSVCFGLGRVRLHPRDPKTGRVLRDQVDWERELRRVRAGSWKYVSLEDKADIMPAPTETAELDKLYESFIEELILG